MVGTEGTSSDHYELRDSAAVHRPLGTQALLSSSLVMPPGGVGRGTRFLRCGNRGDKTERKKKVALTFLLMSSLLPPEGCPLSFLQPRLYGKRAGRARLNWLHVSIISLDTHELARLWARQCQRSTDKRHECLAIETLPGPAGSADEWTCRLSTT